MKKEIKNLIEYHKNKKIDVLTTYWNLKNNGFNYLLDDFFKLKGCCNAPIKILNYAVDFRDYLKEVLKND